MTKSPRGRAEAARNPSGDGHLRPSALSFVGGDHPDRHPPHSAPSDRRSPPCLPRDFYYGLPALDSRPRSISFHEQNLFQELAERLTNGHHYGNGQSHQREDHAEDNHNSETLLLPCRQGRRFQAQC